MRHGNYEHIRQRWEADGVLILRSSVSPEVNQTLIADLNHTFETLGNPGHALIPMIPGAQVVINDPVVSNTLASVLDTDYVLDKCRHVHLNDSPAYGDWHQDDYCGQPLPQNRDNWAMICYFPQDTPPTLGPTAFRSLSDREVLASGEAGTFALSRIDIWHQATANVMGTSRYMLKFLFHRSTRSTY